MEISLSRTERLILFNQFKILAKLDPTGAEYYQHCQTIITSGFVLEYPKLVEDFGEVSTEKCREVRDVLNMYVALNIAYDQMEDKSGIDPHSILFPGFDGNGESSHLAYASFLRASNLWQTVFRASRSDDLNSHCPELQRYQIMLDRYNQSADLNQLTRDDVLRIVAPIQW